MNYFQVTIEFNPPNTYQISDGESRTIFWSTEITGILKVEFIEEDNVSVYFLPYFDI